ncbi:MAG: DsbC family protein [Gammaproteobacteria bacterium]|nr:DsbC family protein [Gammaproteobacteria bacterium]MBU1414480.1 DsbC family protein [Gammaproteobacteria bacterium]
MIKQIIATFFTVGIAVAACAQSPEADIKKNVEAALGKGAKVDSVREAGALGLYEVVVGGDILYTDKKASYLVLGHIVDPRTRKDLTQARLDKLSAIKFSELPLDLAIKQVKGNGGNGKRTIATFEDPNCTYCKKLAKELQGVTDITIYTFVYPILSQDSHDKSKAIWCSSDRVKAWNDYMLKGTAPAAANCDTSGLDKVMGTAQKLRIHGTPAIFLTDGTRLPGFMPAAALEQAMAQAADSK